MRSHWSTVLYRTALCILLSVLAIGPIFTAVSAQNPPAIVEKSLYAPLAAGAGMVATSAEHQTGLSSWNSNRATVEWYIDPEAYGVGTKTIGDIASVEYYSKNEPVNPALASPGVDFGLYIYTPPVGGTGWYGERLTAEPLYSQQRSDPDNQWNFWSTSSPTNTLTWYSSHHNVDAGWSGAPTLAQMQAADFRWSDYTSKAGVDTNVVNYSAMEIMAFKFGTGTAWSSQFNGWLDAVTINFKDGSRIVLDLENQATNLYVDDSWIALPPNQDPETNPGLLRPGEDPDGSGPATAFGSDAFNAIQPAIDAAASNATVSIYPGSYPTGISKTNVDPKTGGSGGNSFILFANKPGLTLRGVNPASAPITNAADVAAFITATAVAPTFGASTLFIQADGVTVQGLSFGPMPDNANKTIEIWGNNFTLRHSQVDGGDGGSTLYFNEDKVTGYIVDGNQLNAGIAIASGAGSTGDRASRQIINNQITSTFYGVGFRGENITVVPWYAKPVGGAVIEGNTFSGSPYGHVYADGNYTETDLHWTEILDRNTFDKTVVTLNASGSIANNPWSYNGGYFRPNLRRIGSVIQYELDRAAAGDTINVSSGLFPEELTFKPTVEDVSLIGAGADETIIQAADANVGFTVNASGPNSLIQGVTIRNDAALTNSIGVAFGYQGSGSRLAQSKVEGFLTGVYLSSGLDGIILEDNLVTGNANGILIEGTLNNATIRNNEISANTRADDYFAGRPNASIRVLDGFTGQDNVIEHNALVGSSRGVDNNDATSITAERNWWGSAYGPAQGSKAEGAVDADPWLCSGVDTQPDAIGFQPASGGCTANTDARLVFTTQPASTRANQPFAASPALRVEDDLGNLLIGFDENVTLTLNANGQGCALRGTFTVAAVDGVVAFPGLSVSRSGEHLTITASANGLTSVTSDSFDITDILYYFPLVLRP